MIEERATTTRLQQSPLHDEHVRLGAGLIDFGGWEMPVKYSGIIEEHHAVRKEAGLFDISHMGEIWVSGARAAVFLDWVLTNNIHDLEVGKAQYSLMCNEGGGVVDDLYVYCVGHGTFLLIVNASRIGPDSLWLREKLGVFNEKSDVVLKNVSAKYSAVALQGPAVAGFINNAISGNGLIKVDRPTDLKKNEIDAFVFDDEDIFVSRTGYTGEDGFEIVVPVGCIAEVWERLLLAGESFGLKPCGLGARDTLRLEMGYPLYGHELSEEITPIEAGLGYFVKLDKGEFIGKEPLIGQKEKKPEKRCAAFRLLGKSPPPRSDYTIWGEDKIWNTGDKSILGKVTSGNQSPTLGYGIGLAMVQSHYSKTGSKFDVKIRDKYVPAEVVRKPFYKP